MTHIFGKKTCDSQQDPVFSALKLIDLITIWFYCYFCFICVCSLVTPHPNLSFFGQEGYLRVLLQHYLWKKSHSGDMGQL